jgi:hypothetical protein
MEHRDGARDQGESHTIVTQVHRNLLYGTPHGTITVPSLREEDDLRDAGIGRVREELDAEVPVGHLRRQLEGPTASCGDFLGQEAAHGAQVGPFNGVRHGDGDPSDAVDAGGENAGISCGRGKSHQ